MTKLLEAKCDNKFEDCVTVKLHFDLQNQSGVDRLLFQRQTEIDVSMTIRFGQEQFMEINVPLFEGKVYFGIRRGELELILENCRLPIEKVALYQAFQLSLEVENSVQKNVDLQVGTAPSRRETKNVLNKAKTLSSQVEQVGGERSPKWIFKSKSEREPLLGYKSKEKLGIMVVETRPCRVMATFTASGENIWINRGKVGFTEGQDLSNSKWAVIERLIAIKYIGKKLDTPISEMSWEYV